MRKPANNKITARKRATEAINTCPVSGMLAHKLLLKQLYVMCYYAKVLLLKKNGRPPHATTIFSNRKKRRVNGGICCYCCCYCYYYSAPSPPPTTSQKIVGGALSMLSISSDTGVTGFIFKSFHAMSLASITNSLTDSMLSASNTNTPMRKC